MTSGFLGAPSELPAIATAPNSLAAQGAPLAPLDLACPPKAPNANAGEQADPRPTLPRDIIKPDYKPTPVVAADSDPNQASGPPSPPRAAVHAADLVVASSTASSPRHELTDKVNERDVDIPTNPGSNDPPDKNPPNDRPVPSPEGPEDPPDRAEEPEPEVAEDAGAVENEADPFAECKAPTEAREQAFKTCCRALAERGEWGHYGHVALAPMRVYARDGRDVAGIVSVQDYNAPDVLHPYERPNAGSETYRSLIDSGRTIITMQFYAIETQGDSERLDPVGDTYVMFRPSDLQEGSITATITQPAVYEGNDGATIVELAPISMLGREPGDVLIARERPNADPEPVDNPSDDPLLVRAFNALRRSPALPGVDGITFGTQGGDPVARRAVQEYRAYFYGLGTEHRTPEGPA